ncbi:hypothetical protein E2C01_064420 [Portunus trituberculatus]|uniref:Uncharacterized protein n=1 Tax=Portunus trituberculatus TaxID=210409 RepID=A0A5B7HKA1_PORTR|nr:hypothetical protein [Portunus trituberculatus]
MGSRRVTRGKTTCQLLCRCLHHESDAQEESRACEATLQFAPDALIDNNGQFYLDLRLET